MDYFNVITSRESIGQLEREIGIVESALHAARDPKSRDTCVSCGVSLDEAATSQYLSRNNHRSTKAETTIYATG